MYAIFLVYYSIPCFMFYHEECDENNIILRYYNYCVNVKTFFLKYIGQIKAT